MRLLLGSALALAATAAEAGPWGLGPGHTWAKVSYSRLRSTTLANPDGSLARIPRFDKHEAGLYVAHGLSERLTLIGTVPAYRSSRLREFGSESGFGDVQAGLQVQLGRLGLWVLAARGTGQAPTGDETRAEGLLPTGSGAWEGEALLSVGRSFAGGKLYGFAEAGHQVRGAQLRDNFAYAAQVGWNVSERLVLAANVRGVEPYDSSAPLVARGSPVGLSDRVTYLIYGPTVLLKGRRGIGVQLDLEAATRARNLAKGVTLRAGVFLSR